uniref:Uncharacterized protein n=1 Tax=Anguilla anguilla TaxID=7936 RepID=A0A0E9X2J1_ANGAN
MDKRMPRFYSPLFPYLQGPMPLRTRDEGKNTLHPRTWHDDKPTLYMYISCYLPKCTIARNRCRDTVVTMHFIITNANRF